VEAVELRGPAPRARPLSIRGRHFREGQERSLAGATSGHLESRHGNHRHRLQPRGAGDWRKHRAPLRVLGQRVPGHVCCGRSRDDPRRVCRQAAYAPLYQSRSDREFVDDAGGHADAQTALNAGRVGRQPRQDTDHGSGLPP